MNKIPNRQAICETLMAHAKEDRHIYALCSDSRGSASMTPFFNAFPEQSIEVGIAEQNLVSIAAGMAHCGEKPYCFSPACFISTRSYEQAKVDVAYSNTNVKLIGISGGISVSITEKSPPIWPPPDFMIISSTTLRSSSDLTVNAFASNSCFFIIYLLLTPWIVSITCCSTSSYRSGFTPIYLHASYSTGTTS